MVRDQDRDRDRDRDRDPEPKVPEKKKKKKENKTRTVHANTPYDLHKGQENPNRHYAKNRIKTTKYTVLSFLPKNLFEQFHRFANVYFVFIALLNFVPVVKAFQPELALAPVLFILSVTAVKDLWEDYRRHRSDTEINHMDCLVYCRAERRYVERFWKEVRVGDFIRLRCNEILPADVLLLSSSDPDRLCHIETATLDGETNLKQRQVVRTFYHLDCDFDPLKYNVVIECEKPNNDLNRFRGYIVHGSGRRDALSKDNLLLRGCTVRNTEEAVGIVIYAGHETKAMLNNNGPRYKRSKLERQMNVDVFWSVVILLVMCLFTAVGHGLWMFQYGDQRPVFDVLSPDGTALSPVTSAVYLFLTMIIVFQVLIPISLFVSLEIVKVCQVYFIHQDCELYDEESDSQLQCRALNITEDLGQMQYVFSDKTGTLTDNKMVFRRCTAAGVEYSHSANARRLAMYQELDSEDEDFLPPPGGGTLPRRDSLSSVHSARAVLRTHSTKSHRRTGSRAEAKRASILSKHTAFSSPMEKDITPDPQLLERVNEAGSQMDSLRFRGQPLSQLPSDLGDIVDFFVALTVCNTVVVSSPDQPRHKVRVRSELKSPVKTIEDFLRRFTPSRLTSSSSASSLSTGRSLTSPASPSPASPPDPDLDSSFGPAPPRYEGRPRPPEQGELRYEAESPDEAALVYAARAYGCVLVGRGQDRLEVELPHLGRLTFTLLHTLGFDSTRKRMSVVVRHPLTQHITVYTKGADSAIMDLIQAPDSGSSAGRRQKKIMSRTQNYLNLYAADGLRTLCIAKKVLDQDQYSRWLQLHLQAETAIQNREEKLFESALRLETDLQLLGATGIEDRLQDGVPETVLALRRAGLQVWVLTGDKQETAVNIAYACRLLDPEEEILTLNADSQDSCSLLLDQSLHYIQAKFLCSSAPSDLHPPSSPPGPPPVLRLGLVIDGRTLAWALVPGLEDRFLALARSCRSVLCCRSTPLQKSNVVQLVRTRLRVMTLAIGDGANDVSMIQAADVGIGISGQEGMQAVMASDFAVPRFRYLKKLLLVHGHWSYSRLSSMILYFFYKNAMLVALIFWFQFYCGFSGSAMIDQWFLIFFNLLFSAFPPLVSGTLDQDVSAETLQNLPQLYATGQNSEDYKPYMFWMNMLDAFYQSLVCFFIPYYAYLDSDVDLFSWGTPITTLALITILVHLGIETKTWTWMNWVSLSSSLVLFLGVSVVYTAWCPSCWPPSNPYWTLQRLLLDPHFYLLALITPVAALLPRFLYRSCQGSLFPSPVQVGRQLDRLPPETRRNLLSLSGTRTGTGSPLDPQPPSLSLSSKKDPRTDSDSYRTPRVLRDPPSPDRTLEASDLSPESSWTSSTPLVPQTARVRLRDPQSVAYSRGPEDGLETRVQGTGVQQTGVQETGVLETESLHTNL